jgi:hypothetical protein
VHDLTNLQWPEAPFGAQQRPFGGHADMLAAFTIDWAPQPGSGLWPVAAATVYLRVRRHGTAYQVGEDNLSIGFRTVITEDLAEVPELLALADRALTRARRHAAILAGHRLGDDLTRMSALSGVPLRGVAGVLDAWADRTVKERGMALMIDTATDARTVGSDLDMPLEAPSEPAPHDPGCCAAVARTALARCLAVGLTAAVHAGRYRWEGTFRVNDAIERVAWDVLSLSLDTFGDHPHDTTGRPVSPSGW